MTTTSRYTVAVVGESVLLPCTAQGFPPPKFTWFKLGLNNQLERINTISSQHFPKKVLQIYGSLHIRPVSVDDSGKYVCVCNNTVGQDRTEMELLVRGISPSHWIEAQDLILCLFFRAFKCDTESEPYISDGQHIRWLQLQCFGFTRRSSRLEKEWKDYYN